MNMFIRIFAFAIVVFALFSGHFTGSDRCSCGAGTAFAQASSVAPAFIPTDVLLTGVSSETLTITGSATVAPAIESASTTVLVSPATEPAVPVGSTAMGVRQPLPKLVDLGAGKCLACKKMAPILEEAKKLYSGLAEVEFIDVWENRDAGSKFGIRTIPTQIFFDAAGKEVLRHEGLFLMEDIQKQFESMGVVLKKAP